VGPGVTISLQFRDCTLSQLKSIKIKWIGPYLSNMLSLIVLAHVTLDIFAHNVAIKFFFDNFETYVSMPNQGKL